MKFLGISSVVGCGVCFFFGHSNSDLFVLFPDSVLANSSLGRRDLYHYVNPWRLAICATTFSAEGCRRFIDALQTRLFENQKMFEGEFLAVLLDFIKEKEVEYGHAHRSEMVQAMRKLNGEKSLKLFASSDLKTQRVPVLNLFHWYGSIYQHRAQEKEVGEEKDDKVKFSVVLSSTPFQVGYGKAPLLDMEQALFNPLKDVVLKDLLSHHDEPDFTQLDFLGRLGVWRLTDDVWQALMWILNQLCTQLAVFVSETGLVGIGLFQSLRWTQLEDVRNHNRHLDCFLNYRAEENIRECIKTATAEDHDTADMLALLVCFQVWEASIFSKCAYAMHACLQGAAYLAFLRQRAPKMKKYSAGTQNAAFIATQWQIWRQQFTEVMNEFEDQGTIRRITPAFERKLKEGVQKMTKRMVWGSSQGIRTMALRTLLTVKFITSFSIVLDVSAIQEPRSREDLRRFYVSFFEKVQDRLDERVSDAEVRLLRWIRSNFLQGIHYHSPNVAPYIDLEDEDVEEVRLKIQRFLDPTVVRRSQASAEFDFPFDFVEGQSHEENFRVTLDRVQAFRDIHREYIQRQQGGDAFLRFVSNMDVEIGRETMKREKPPLKVRQTLKWILNEKGKLANASNWGRVKMGVGRIGDMGNLPKLARLQASANCQTAQQTRRASPPPPAAGTPSQMTVTQMSVDREEAAEVDMKETHSPEESQNAAESGTADVDMKEPQRSTTQVTIDAFAREMGDLWSAWTLSNEAESSTRNRDGAKIMAGAFYELCAAIAKVGAVIKGKHTVEIWLEALDQVDRIEMTECFVMWITCLCRPKSTDFLICLDDWLDERMEPATRCVWDILRTFASEMAIDEQLWERFVFYVLTTAVGYNHMKRLVRKSAAMGWDVDHTQWNTWRINYGADLLGYVQTKMFGMLVSLIHRHGVSSLSLISRARTRFTQSGRWVTQNCTK